MQQIKATQNKDGTYKVKILDYNLNDEKVTMVIPRAQVSITAYNSFNPEGELYTIEVENEREDLSIKPDFCSVPCGFMRQIIQDQRAQIEGLKKDCRTFIYRLFMAWEDQNYEPFKDGNLIFKGYGCTEEEYLEFKNNYNGD